MKKATKTETIEEQPRKGVIYAWLNRINGKIYVGQSLNPKGRFYGHIARFRKGDQHPLYAAMRHDDLKSFVYVILESEICASNLDAHEIDWIKRMNSTDRQYGYNLEAGGKGKGQISEETRARLKISRRNRKPFSVESRRRMGLSHCKIWSDDVVQTILKMHTEGFSIRAIGKILSLTTNRARIAKIVKDQHDYYNV